MRLRTVMALTAGAAAGAGATYLFDPDLGPQRRRHARRNALRQGRVVALHALRRATQEVASAASAGVVGYQQAREAARATEIGEPPRSTVARPTV